MVQDKGPDREAITATIGDSDRRNIGGDEVSATVFPGGSFVGARHGNLRVVIL